MTIEAKLPDGTTLLFPDETDPAVIQSKVKEILGQPVSEVSEVSQESVTQESTQHPLAHHLLVLLQLRDLLGHVRLGLLLLLLLLLSWHLSNSKTKPITTTGGGCHKRHTTNKCATNLTPTCKIALCFRSP